MQNQFDIAMYDRPLSNISEQRAKSEVDWLWTIQIDSRIKVTIPRKTKAKNPKETRNEKRE